MYFNMDKHHISRVCTSIAIVRQRYFVNSSRPRANPARLVWWFFPIDGSRPRPRPRYRATKIGFVSPGNTATGAAATGSRVSQSSSSDVGRSAEPSGRVKRGRADVESSLSLCVCVSLWLSDPLSLSLVALDPAPTKKRALATESNQINQSARRRRRRRGRVEESSRRREARGRVPDDRGARRGRRRRRIETKDTAV